MIEAFFGSTNSWQGTIPLNSLTSSYVCLELRWCGKMGYSRSGPVKPFAPKILMSHFVKNVSKICLPYSLDLLRYPSQNSTQLLP